MLVLFTNVVDDAIDGEEYNWEKENTNIIIIQDYFSYRSSENKYKYRCLPGSVIYILGKLPLAYTHRYL